MTPLRKKPGRGGRGYLPPQIPGHQTGPYVIIFEGFHGDQSSLGILCASGNSVMNPAVGGGGTPHLPPWWQGRSPPSGKIPGGGVCQRPPSSYVSKGWVFAAAGPWFPLEYLT